MIFEIAERISGWVYALRIMTLGQRLLRGAMLAVVVGLVLLTTPWVLVVLVPPWLMLMTVLALWAVIRPDSSGPLSVVVVFAMAWLSGAADADWWRLGAVAALVGVFHLLSAYAADGPSFAEVRIRPTPAPPAAGAGPRR